MQLLIANYLFCRRVLVTSPAFPHTALHTGAGSALGDENYTWSSTELTTDTSEIQRWAEASHKNIFIKPITSIQGINRSTRFWTAKEHVQNKAGKWMLRASGEASAEEQQSQLLDSIVSHIPNMNFLATSHRACMKATTCTAYIHPTLLLLSRKEILPKTISARL